MESPVNMDDLLKMSDKNKAFRPSRSEIDGSPEVTKTPEGDLNHS